MKTSEPRLVVVRTYSNKFEAEVAKSALDAADIVSMIRADDAVGYPGLWVGNGVELIVRAEDAAQALEILEQSATWQALTPKNPE